MKDFEGLYFLLISDDVDGFVLVYIYETRPSDSFLFHNEFDNFIKTSTADQILTWISTRKRAIENSVKQWKKHNNKGVQSIIGWLLNFSDDNNSRYQNLQRSMRKRHDLDGRQKERRRRQRKSLSTHPSRQTKLAKFFTLTRSS